MFCYNAVKWITGSLCLSIYWSSCELYYIIITNEQVIMPMFYLFMNYESLVCFVTGSCQQGPENSTAFLINIHEPIIWRLHEMIQQVKLSRLYDSQTTAASVDPIIQIGYARLFGNAWLSMLVSLTLYMTLPWITVSLIFRKFDSKCQWRCHQVKDQGVCLGSGHP